MKKVLSFSLFFAILISSAFAVEEGKRESYAAVVVGTGGSIGGRTLNLNIHIDRYTSDQEVQEYLTLLREEGQEALRRKLEKVQVGRISPAAAVGTELSVARSFETEEGKVIRLVTPRPVGFLEAWRSGRSRDYTFTIMELRLNHEGKGVGSIIGGARLSFDDEGKLARVVVTRAAIMSALRLRSFWRSVQELGGVNNSFAANLCI